MEKSRIERSGSFCVLKNIPDGKENFMEYLKLIGLKVGAFETTVKEENNFADSEEGRMNLEKTAQEWEKKGLYVSE